MGLHPAIAAVRLGVRRELADLEPGATVVVACSGGADSLALVAATVFEAKAAAWQVIGATVDHGLQDESAEVALRVVGQMATLGVAETVSVRVRVETAGQGPEAAARSVRYAVLTEVAERYAASAVLLGHTRDDQAETVLLGLTRGSGGRSLAGMRRRFELYRRPLLDVDRADTVAACQVEGIVFWEDPHNQEPRFARARVRSHVLPVLEAELGPGVARALARTADQLRADAEFLDDTAGSAFAALGPAPLAVAGLAALPDAVRRRVVRLACLEAGALDAELFYDHVVAVDSLLTDWHGQRWIDLPGAVRALRRDGQLVFERDI